jgi:D-aminopeptidase
MSTQRPRVRDLGITIGYMPTGTLNAITDVEGIKVGQETISDGSGAHIRGKGPIRTGVTIVFPHSGDTYLDRVVTAVEWLNGFGECLGAGLINEFGFMIGPIVLTSSFNVYRVADALQDWSIGQHPEVGIETHGLLCTVAECSDDFLNDVQGRHVHLEHVLSAIEGARGGVIAEGAVGAGTGMTAFGFKGGIGTSSRLLPKELGGFVVGVLVLANFGIREQLTIAGVPVGRELLSWKPENPYRQEEGSCVMIVATDAPLTSRQLKRLTKRAFLGMARTGGTARNGSGDLAIAFSTSNIVPRDPNALTQTVKMIPDFRENTINALFQATVEATEEAILNSLFKADTMVGRDNHTSFGLPLREMVDIMRKYGRSDVRYPA